MKNENPNLADDACYLGKITPRVYKAARRLRGDDECCWGERVRLSEPALTIPEMPEEADGDVVIEIWEEALANAREEFGDGNFVLDSMTLYLDGEIHDSEIVGVPNVRRKN